MQHLIAVPDLSAVKGHSPAVRLEILNGPLKGQCFNFAERTRLVIGRGSSCTWPVPDSYNSISRHHCVIEISPPHISVRDLGSLNGTHLNKNCIGQRAKGMAPETGALLAFPDHPVKHRDELLLGIAEPNDGLNRELRMRVQLFAAARCGSCNQELSDVNAFELPSGSEALCVHCHPKSRVPSLQSAIRCVVCGSEHQAPGGVVLNPKAPCESCRQNPEALIRHLKAQKELEAGLGGLHDYDVLQHIGRGGFGSVFLARHRRTNRRVALKVMLPSMAADTEARRRFEREIENTKALDHPNVMNLFEEGYAGGLYFFSMDYCESGNISHLMRRRGGVLSVEEALFLTFQVLEGLHYAHHAVIPRVRLADGSYGPGVGLVHRDIKPCNLLLQGTGSERIVKVSDYGMAKAFDKAGLSGVTRAGTFAGSIPFIARRQALDFGAALPDVDVWAAAATLYFMLTGMPPRHFQPNVDPLTVVLQQPAVPIRQRNPIIPAKLAAVIDEALMEEPNRGIKEIATLQKQLRLAC